MTSAERAISHLDSALLRFGQTVTLVRLGSPATTTAARGFVRGFKPNELGNGVLQGDSQVVISPTTLVDSVFAAALPTVNDKLETAGRRRNIAAVEPLYLDDVLVRINLVVRG